MERQVNNLFQLLEQAAETTTSGVIIYPPGDVEDSCSPIPYRSLFRQAKQDAKVVQGINPKNSIVLLHFEEHGLNIRWFWATVIAGCVPVVSPPFTKDTDQRLRHLTHLRHLLDNPVVLTQAKICSDFTDIEGFAVHCVEKLEAPTNGYLHHSATEMDAPVFSHYDVANFRLPSDLAVLMLTSGSTGNAKAVCLRHGQILSALEGKRRHHEVGMDDIFLNWIGLDHVANLCEIHLHAMSVGLNQVHVQASDLLASPGAFLRLIQRHRISYTFAPNFFLALLRQYLVNNIVTDDLDLWCLKALISGGEANVVETCAALTEQLFKHGASRRFIRPGFGMTETCAGMIYGLQCPSYDLDNSLEFACLGLPIPGTRMRIAFDNDAEATLTADGTIAKEVATNEVGSLQVAGTAIFGGYYNNDVATREAFTEDGWFKTGDRALKDFRGNLSLVGRTKESIIVNGVKYFPHELETALEETFIGGLTPSYTVVFPHRPKGAETETLCVAYLPQYCSDDTEALVLTTDAVAKVCVTVCGVRPWAILPLSKKHLSKSSLGKISRIKLRTAFEDGAFQHVQEANDQAIRNFRIARRVRPSSDREETILGLLEEQFHLSVEEFGVDVSLFDIGVTSVDLIGFKRRLEEKLQLEVEIPLILVLTNPTVRAMAKALEGTSSPRSYNPVVTMQPHGSKTPLWLVHPGVGEVLVFLNLAKSITDRPVYALRARGFDDGEEYFGSIHEIVSTYHSHIKAIQPKGPYAIAGYSFGAMLAFEISKVLEAQQDEVRFLGSLNLPPHIKHRMKQLDWIEVVLNLSYFLGLMTEEEAQRVSPAMHEMSNDEVLEAIVSGASQERLSELSLDRSKLATWTSLAHAMQYAARDYNPSGSVANIDVFVADPLSSVSKGRADWIENHLSKWKDFSRTESRIHEVRGAHYTMLAPEHVLSFQQKLRSVLTSRGL